MAPRPRRAEAPRFRLFSFSLAATGEVEFSFLSCGYLDVSVHRVGLVHLWIGCTIIRESRDQRLFDGSPELIAAFHALHRLLTPRHPPHALSSLTTMILVSHPTRPLRPAESLLNRESAASATGRSENKLLPRLPALRADRRLVTRHVPKSLFILTRSAPKKVFGTLCASSIKMPLLPLPNCQRTNRKTSGPQKRGGVILRSQPLMG
jgi:hypothetical protein